jgi:hypothetical protein
MCRQFLRGIGWTYSYYVKGSNAINLDWYYPYFHSPLITDLAQVASAVLSEKDGFQGYQNTGQIFVNPIIQLLSVMPVLSRNLLPQETLILFDIRSPIVDLYPSTFKTEVEGKSAIWQGITIIPFINVDRVIDAVRKHVIFNQDTIQKFVPGTVIMVTQSPYNGVYITAIQATADRKSQQTKLPNPKLCRITRPTSRRPPVDRPSSSSSSAATSRRPPVVDRPSSSSAATSRRPPVVDRPASSSSSSSSASSSSRRAPVTGQSSQRSIVHPSSSEKDRGILEERRRKWSQLTNLM